MALTWAGVKPPNTRNVRSRTSSYITRICREVKRTCFSRKVPYTSRSFRVVGDAVLAGDDDGKFSFAIECACTPWNQRSRGRSGGDPLGPVFAGDMTNAHAK